jgi:hypothetical protein
MKYPEEDLVYAIKDMLELIRDANSPYVASLLISSLRQKHSCIQKIDDSIKDFETYNQKL